MNSKILALALAIAVAPPPASADGIVMTPHEAGWRAARENSQRALITHREGTERLTVAVEVAVEDAKSMVWILPVPAAPKQVHVDVLASFPEIFGTEVYGGAVRELANMRKLAAVTQFWPILPGLVFGLFDVHPNLSPPGPEQRMKAVAEADSKKGKPVVVHERVEKEDMVSEVITASEGAALYKYLAGKGLDLNKGSVPTLDFYIGKDYTFVASWFAAGGQRPSLARAIEIRFSSEQIFFPLRPTSAYGERVVPASIIVAGHVTPRPFADIAPRMFVTYNVAGWPEGDEEAALGTDLYTQIGIYAPAKALTQDLWISPEPPRQRGLGLAVFLVRHPVIAFILLLVPVSALASLAAGWAIFKELRTGKGALRLLLAGLGNCVTLLGMLVSVSLLPAGRIRQIAYLSAFSLLFLVGMAGATWQGDAVLEAQVALELRQLAKAVKLASEIQAARPRSAPTPATVTSPTATAAELESLYREAVAMESGGDLKGAIRIYRRAARAGSGKAAKRLWEIYDKGALGVARDDEEAYSWLENARKLGENIETAGKR